MINRIALEGIDGSGKTTVADAITTQLAKEDVRVFSFSIFRDANTRLGHNIYDLWNTQTGAELAIRTLKDSIESAEEQAATNGYDLLIYDRHWMTVMTEITHNNELSMQWDKFIPAALLRVSPMAAQRRMSNDRLCSWSTLSRQNTYANRYGTLALKNPDRMLGIYRTDEDVTADAIARNIIWDMNIKR